ncbi:hypothetical protein GBA52_008853 [Prunus armeniaca]|nr:hypothetical protein GBA52_008853 [Prunus armeniaca]
MGQRIIGRRIVLHGERREIEGRSRMKPELQRIAMVSSSDMILDSGCSYHMFSNKSWFDTYEMDYGSEVMMGDGSVYKVERACTIKETNALHYALNISEGDPTTFQEAVEISERESWMSAMMDKMESLHQNSIWELVPNPKDR